LKSENLKLNIINQKLKNKLQENQNFIKEEEHLTETQEKNKRKSAINVNDDRKNKIFIRDNDFLNQSRESHETFDQKMEWEFSHKESCLKTNKIKNVYINNYFNSKMESDQNYTNFTNKVNSIVDLQYQNLISF
jgi:hypothetical protein